VHPCRAIQNEYSLWTRQPELGLIQTCKALGVAFIPFSPLARGVFGRQIVNPDDMAPGEFRRSIPRFQDPDWQYNRAQVGRFRAFAAQRGVTPSALALAWVLAQGDHLIPIPGTRTADHLGDWQGAADITLTAEDHKEINSILPVGWANGDRYGHEQAATAERYC
jgi:aryl-alcohol dehydrogenase-like predicted oxidoreductase